MAEDRREKYSQEESIQTTLERRDGTEYLRTSPGWTNRNKGGGREGEAHVERCRFNSLRTNEVSACCPVYDTKN